MEFPSSPMSSLVDDVITYELGESTCPPLSLGELFTPEVLERLSGTDLGYRTTLGDPELRTQLAGNLGIDPHQIVVTAGGIAAMHLVTLVMCDPGDEVVVATPCFPPALAVPTALKAQVRPLRLSFDNSYALDIDALEAELSDRTRLVSLASPQNPSGQTMSDSTLRRVLDVVERRAPRAVIMLDETYRETVYDGNVPPSRASISPRVVTVSSLSKSHGAPGLRIGWVTAVDPDLHERLRLAKFNTQVSGAAADEILGLEVLRRSTNILTERRAKLKRTLDVLTRWAADHDNDVEFLRPDGGALCCLRLAADQFDDAAVRRFYDTLPSEDCRVAPGAWFDEEDRVFRLGFGHLREEVFAHALNALSHALKRSRGRVTNRDQPATRQPETPPR